MQFLLDEVLNADYPKSAAQRWRDRRAGLFPPAVKLGHKNATVDTEYETFKAVTLARRDYPKLAAKLTQWLKDEKAAGRNPWSKEKLDAWINAHK